MDGWTDRFRMCCKVSQIWKAHKGPRVKWKPRPGPGKLPAEGVLESEGVERRQLSFTVAGNTNDSSHFGKQFGGLLQS